MVDDQPNEFPALVVVGASAGGIDALSELLGPIPAAFPAPIVVAQHTQPVAGEPPRGDPRRADRADAS